MTTPRRTLDAADLLHGEDHEFIVNMYLAVLRRWPDEAGYRHFMRKIANRPERRADALRETAGSEEASRLGSVVEIPADLRPGGDPDRAREAMLSVRLEMLQAEVGRLREAVELLSGTGGEELAGLQRELAEAREAEFRSELNAVRRELRETLAGLAAPPPHAVGAEQALAAGLARLFADYIEARLGGLGQRLNAIEAQMPPAPSGP
jgi:Domain of unknown function (DUF4214)